VRTTFYGSGQSGSVETTALAVLAFLKAREHPGTASKALAWISQQRDKAGTWYSTQATVLALRALVEATGLHLRGEQERRISVQIGEHALSDIVIKPDQADVLQQLDLSRFLAPGTQRLTLRTADDTAVNYQLLFRYHVPGEPRVEGPEPFSVRLEYDRTDLTDGQSVKATVIVANRMKQGAPMVMLDLPIPPGFALEADDLARAVRAQPSVIAKYQVLPRQVVVYLRGLEPNQTLTLNYRLRATMPVKVSVAPARVYEYYDPQRQAFSAAARLTVSARPGRN
jgi:uncharacterized protein YfaS (alpha-2-macroglobulin family)